MPSSNKCELDRNACECECGVGGGSGCRRNWFVVAVINVAHRMLHYTHPVGAYGRNGGGFVYVRTCIALDLRAIR